MKLILRHRKSLMFWKTNQLQAIYSETSDESILQLRSSRDVEIDLLIKQSDAAPNYCSAINNGQESKAKSWRKIVLPRNVIPIESNAIFESKPTVNGPLVRKIGEELFFVQTECAGSDKVEPFA